ncbi:hypothetical protein [Tepidibacter thalassicus]|uniref:Homeodomain-like domain-containing protein n=1 Tax=Tepidibacter thalassicus DSM 15285 TaxID=1123350 RepID=A0A1M5SWX3_9FIRM|nr:hypothetical protein [Tepidibacter thalassicus]SHH43071.1 hypothetical protein SAMN02744040_01948 [Tepidibacter thalassicus DSM 15285]
MDRNEFNELDILNQIEYFNKKLKENLSISKICKNIGIARTTVTDRFKI